MLVDLDQSHGHLTGQPSSLLQASQKKAYGGEGGGRVKGRGAGPHSYRQKSNTLKHEVWAFIFHFTALQTTTTGLQLLNSFTELFFQLLQLI